MSFKKEGEPKETFDLAEIEVCSILVGSIVRVSENTHYYLAAERDIDFDGHPFEVNFDYKDVYALEDAGHPIVGFWHTHPFQEKEVHYSDTDNTTMKGWCAALGRDLLCVIENAHDEPAVFVFSKQGFVKHGIIWKWSWPYMGEEGIGRILVGSF